MKSILLIGFLFVTTNILSQEMVDTTIYSMISSYAGCYLKTFHETDSLLVTQVFAEDGRLDEELRYYTDGKLERRQRLFVGGRPMLTYELNYNTSHMELIMMDDSGRVRYFEEVATDSFDGVQYSTFPNGQLAQKGFHRLVPIHDVKWINDTAVGPVENSYPLDKARAQVGLWNYYYKNGIDSARGNYSYSCFVHDSVFDDSTDSGYILIGVETYPTIKTGTWNYFSTEGKLTRREEWDDGNLLKRETF